MRLNTKVRYGTRVMLELALHYKQGPLSLSEIAQRQGLPEKYAESLVGGLRAAGLVHSLRGPAGGYVLAAPPERITVRQVYDVFEGGDALAPCLADRAPCERRDACVTQEVWAAMQRAAMQVLESTTLADLVERQQEKQAAAMYAI